MATSARVLSPNFRSFGGGLEMTRLRFRILSIFIGALFVLGLAVAPANAATVTTQSTPQTVSSVRTDGGGGYWGPGYRHRHRHGYWGGWNRGYRGYGGYNNWRFYRCYWYGDCWWY
jgi:hypothetical protein